MHLMIKSFRAETGCNSFLVADEGTRKACVIDPRVDEVDAIEAAVAAAGLEVELVMDSHTHADHFSGTHLAADRFGARIAMGESTKSARAAIRLKDGDQIGIGGGLGLTALATPGHTPDSMSFVVDWGGGRVVFTGDTLFIGGSGRTDFPGADPRLLHASIHDKLGALDGRTWLLPGHDYSGLLFSTIGHEKSFNPHWTISSVEEFVRIKQAEELDSPGVLGSIVDFNLNAMPTAKPRSGAHTLCATICSDGLKEVAHENAGEVADLLASASRDGAIVVDVREPDEFARSRVTGMVNIPLAQLFLDWAELEKASKVYFFCQRGNRSVVAARTAQRLGLRRVVDVRGGLMSWIAAGLPVER